MMKQQQLFLVLGCLFAVVATGLARTTQGNLFDVVRADDEQDKFFASLADSTEPIAPAPVEDNNGERASDILGSAAPQVAEETPDATPEVIPEVVPEVAPEVAPAVAEQPLEPLDKKNYGAHLMRAASQLDEQVKADVNLLTSSLNLPRNHDPQTGFPQNNVIQAIVNFALSETKKPEGERRYAPSTAFADMKDILVEDCKKVNEALGPLMETNFKVDNHRLSVDELAWLTNGMICAQLTRRNPATIRLASIVFKQNMNSSS